MIPLLSKQFLIAGKSFVTKTSDNIATVVRTAAGKPITQTEKETAGDYFNADTNEIEYAEIYNLKFGKNWIKKKGASDEWMSNAVSNKSWKDIFKKATGKNSSNVSSNFPETSTIYSTLSNNQDPNGESTTNRGGNILRYPLNEDKKNYDYIKICAYEYVPRNFDADGNTSTGTDAQNVLTGDYERFINEHNKKKGVHTVFLPMTPQGLSESNNVNWKDGTLNPMDAALANMTGSTVEGAGEGLTQAGKGAVKSTGDALSDLGTSAQEKGAIEGFFAQTAVGNKEIFTRSTGMVVNNNLELLFDGPTLRSFNYNFRFTPRDEKEAKEIRKIIRFFKKSIAPRRSEGQIFLKSPHVFRIEYIFKNGDQHPFLNRIKPCACKNFGVTYAPDGSYMTYDDGSMTAYDISLGFGEMNPIYADDYDELPDTDMGY